MIHPCAQITCPKCGAEPGYKGFTESGRTMHYSYHVERTSIHIYSEATLRTAPKEQQRYRLNDGPCAAQIVDCDCQSCRPDLQTAPKEEK